MGSVKQNIGNYDAMGENSQSIYESEYYKYIIWTIVAVGALAFTASAIRKSN